MEKIDYVAWSDELVKCLGGIDNIISVSHCVTRLRFVLKNYDLINVSVLENLEKVKGTFKAASQFQVIIGPEVITIFDKFIANTNLNHVSKDELKAIAASQGNFLQKTLTHLSEIFIPIVPVLVAGGIILGIRNIFEADFNGWSMVDASVFMKGLDEFLWIPAQVCFWWLPVHICYSIFKKMGATPIIGIVVGLTMLVPPLVNTYEVMANGSKGDSTWIWDIVNSDIDKYTFNFGFMHYPWKIQYTAQVVPAIAIGIIGSYINIWMKKITPAYLYQIAVPLVTILASFIIAMFVVGPAGFIIGSAIAFAFKWAFTNFIAKYFFGFIIGGLFAPIVITGFHHTFNAVYIQNTISNGGNFLFIAGCAQAIAQGGAIVGWMIMNKHDTRVKDVGAPAVVSAWLGVTEPAMYAINLKYVYPFVAACLASAIGTEISVISGVSAFNSGNGAWLGVLNVQVQSKIHGVYTFPGTGYAWFMISMIIDTAAAIVLTMAFSKIKWFKKFELDIKAADKLFK